MDLQQIYLELLAAWGEIPLDEPAVKEILRTTLVQGYDDCKSDMAKDLEAVVGMLIGGTKRQKIANYISEYLLENLKDE